MSETLFQGRHMAAKAVRPPHARASNAYTLFHLVAADGDSACRRGALELAANTMRRAESIPWGQRCRRGRCNSLWAQIPDHSGHPAAEPVKAPRKPYPSGFVKRDVVAAQLLPSSELRLVGHSPYGWRLRLACGHIVDRPAQYRMSDTATSRVHRRSPEDIRPAPGSARCFACAATPAS